MKDFEPTKMKNVYFTGIRRVLEKATKLELAGRNIIHFEVGQPDFQTPEHIRKAAKEALDKGMTRYTSNYGFPALRNAIAEKLKNYNNMIVDPDSEIMVTSGGQEAVAATIMALLDIGDEVLIADPGYSPYESLIKIASAKPVFVPLREEDNFNFNLEELEKAITPKTKMLILNTPSNPTGTIMDRQHLEKLAQICESYDLLVVCDEAYEQVIYDGNEHVSFSTLPGMKDRTVSIFSFSKTYSMCGWRIGYLVASKSLINIIVRVHQNIILSATSFAQMGALAALLGPQDEKDKMCFEFDRRRKLMMEGFEEIGIPFNKPQAGFYLFPNLSEFNMKSHEFADHLLENYGVALVPGVEFGKSGEHHVRISYATSYENCKEGLERIKCCVNDLRNK